MQQENVELYPSTMKTEGDNSSRLLPSPLWSHLQDFFANTLISVAGNSGWGRPPRSPANTAEGGNEAAPRRRGVRHDKLLSDSIGECLCTMTLLIRDVVASCPPLIDRVWNLYSSLFAPYAEPLPSDRTYHRPIICQCSFNHYHLPQYHSEMDQLARQFAQFRWSEASFHIRDYSALREMCRHVLQRKVGFFPVCYNTNLSLEC